MKKAYVSQKKEEAKKEKLASAKQVKKGGESEISDDYINQIKQEMQEFRNAQTLMKQNEEKEAQVKALQEERD